MARKAFFVSIPEFLVQANSEPSSVEGSLAVRFSSFLNRVKSADREGMTAENPAQRQPGPANNAMHKHGLNGILGACGGKTTGGRKQRRYSQLIDPDDRYRNFPEKTVTRKATALKPPGRRFFFHAQNSFSHFRLKMGTWRILRKYARHCSRFRVLR